MKLLDIDNFYCLMITERCNFSCKYCCASFRKETALSKIENDIESVIHLFNTVKPGLITLSGGEPTIAKNTERLLEWLPQHKFAAFSNGSCLPKWIFYDNFILPIVTYHSDCINESVFIKNVKTLFDYGKKVIVKIICKPDENTLPVDIWEKLWSIGIPAHFVPLEYDYYFPLDIIQKVSNEYLTSCLYNSRFFRPEPASIPECICQGGTKDMFEITSK